MTDTGALNQQCLRCGHPDHWHRHADEDCLTAHPQPCSPETAPFRCIGYDCDGPSLALGTPESRCGCRAFQPPLIDRKEPTR